MGRLAWKAESAVAASTLQMRARLRVLFADRISAVEWWN